MKRINTLAEGNYKELLNEKVEGTNKNKYTEKEAGEKWKKEWDAGRWSEVYDKIQPELNKIVTKKVNELRVEYKGDTRSMVTSNKEFIQETILQLAGMNPNQKGGGGHFKRFDIREKIYDAEGKEFGLSGWLNQQIQNKFFDILGVANRLNKLKMESLDKEGYKELVDPDTIDIIETTTSNETVRRIVEESKKPRLHEVINEINKGKGSQAKEIHENVKNKFRNKKGEVDIVKLRDFVTGKNYKTLPGLALPETIRLFTGERRYKNGKLIYVEIAKKIEKNANLSKQDIAAVQPMLDRFMPMIAEYVIPEGFVTKEVKYIEKGVEKSVQVPAEATGVPNVILRIAHNKRSIAGVTTVTGRVVRANENFFGHYKKPITREVLADLREAIGVKKDGTRSVEPRNVKDKQGNIIEKGVGEEIKSLLTLTDRLLPSQPIRELLAAQGTPFESFMLMIGDGRAEKSYAKGEDAKSYDDIIKDIKTSLEIDPGKAAQFIVETMRAKEAMTESQFEKYRVNNGEEYVSFLENYLILSAPGAVGKRFNKYVKDSEHTPEEVSDYISKGGISSESLSERG